MSPCPSLRKFLQQRPSLPRSYCTIYEQNGYAINNLLWQFRENFWACPKQSPPCLPSLSKCSKLFFIPPSCSCFPHPKKLETPPGLERAFAERLIIISQDRTVGSSEYRVSHPLVPLDSVMFSFGSCELCLASRHRTSPLAGQNFVKTFDKIYGMSGWETRYIPTQYTISSK